jgi:hypothetical protein
METDGSDVPQRLGGADSPLYTNLKWAAEVSAALNNGLEITIRNLRDHWHEIKSLPDTGTPGSLKSNVEESLTQVSERLGQNDFYKRAADLNSALTTVRSLVQNANLQIANEQQETVRNAQKEVQGLYEWQELTREEQFQLLADIEKLSSIEAGSDLNGLKRLLSQYYTINNQVEILKGKVKELGRQRRAERMQEVKEGEKIKRTVHVPLRMTSAAHLDNLIQQLQALKDELMLHPDIEITLEIKD